jgi:hypothetical protein
MTVAELITKLQSMVKENASVARSKVQVEYRGQGGCDTCGYGSEVSDDIEESKIYDLDTRVVISVA